MQKVLYSHGQENQFFNDHHKIILLAIILWELYKRTPARKKSKGQNSRSKILPAYIQLFLLDPNNNWGLTLVHAQNNILQQYVKFIYMNK